ncbi:MAG: MvdD family ATP-grasp ribosomal peptide maturase [Myxococcales bacterium]|nr:MvdD family ATP-grasp ribosomal peptide maturase [Myxococcales bacterium]
MRVAPLVLFVTSEHDDAHIHRLRAVLARRRARVVVFDPARFPSEVRLRLTYEGADRRMLLTADGRETDLAAVSAVYWQRPRAPQASPRVPAEEREWVARQSTAALDGLWDRLDVLWVPGRRREAEASDAKVRQLEVAERAGMRVPRTLITNDPAEALRFYAACEGRVVSKVLRNGAVLHDGEKHLAYTHVFRRRDLHQLESVALAPVIFQELVPKRIELRVNVVGDRVFAAAIDSTASPFAREDLRRAEHLVGCTAHTLDSEVQAQCVRIVRDLGITFGAIDMVVTPAGEHVFLEVNAAGAWMWVEARVGLPIAEALADLMLDGRTKRRRPEVRAERV